MFWVGTSFATEESPKPPSFAKDDESGLTAGLMFDANGTIIAWYRFYLYISRLSGNLDVSKLQKEC